MSDQDKFRRMLDMLMLLSSTNGATIESLASRYNVSKRSIYRYVRTFKEVGFIIKKNGHLYKVETLDTDYEDISELVYFSEEESHLLSQVIHNLNEEGHKHRQLASKLMAVYNSGMIASELVPKREVQKVKDLIAAIEEKLQVVLGNYRYGGVDEGSDVFVEPFAFSEDMKGIWAYSIQTGQNEFFKIGRITSVSIKATPWEHEDNHQQGNIDVFNSEGFGKRKNVHMDLDRVAYAKIRRLYPRTIDYITRVYSERYTFKGPVINYEGIGEFVLSIPDHIKVNSPKAFKEYLKQKASKVLNY